MQALTRQLHSFAQLVGLEGPITLRAGLMYRWHADDEMTDEVEVGHPHAPVTLYQIADALQTIPPECGVEPSCQVTGVRRISDKVFELTW